MDKISLKMIQNAITAHCHKSDRPCEACKYAYRFIV